MTRWSFLGDGGKSRQVSLIIGRGRIQFGGSQVPVLWTTERKREDKCWSHGDLGRKPDENLQALFFSFSSLPTLKARSQRWESKGKGYWYLVCCCGDSGPTKYCYSIVSRWSSWWLAGVLLVRGRWYAGRVQGSTYKVGERKESGPTFWQTVRRKMGKSIGNKQCAGGVDEPSDTRHRQLEPC